MKASLLEQELMLAALKQRDFSLVFRLLSQHQGASQAGIAAATGLTQGRVSKIMSGKGGQIAHIDVLERIADGLKIPGALVGLSIRPWEIEESEIENAYGENGEGQILRRGVLRFGMAATVAGLTSGSSPESEALNRILSKSNITEERLEDLERSAQSLSVEIVKKDPASLMSEILSNFRTVRRLVQDGPRTAHRVRLVRTGAQLATIVGESLFNQGEFDQAREWYSTAYHAALDVGDRYAGDISLAGQSYLEVYSDDPQGVIHILSGRLASCHSKTPAAAWLWAFLGKAHAQLGDRSLSLSAFERSRSALDESPASAIRPGIFSFVPEKLKFYEAAAHILLGDAASAVTVADEALKLYDLTETTEPALVRFERASALVLLGEMEEACRFATATLLDPRTYQSVTVRARAQKFDGLLGGSSTNTHVELWREVLRNTQP